MKRIPWYLAAALLAVLGYAVLKSGKSQEGIPGTGRTQSTQEAEPVHPALPVYPTLFGTLPAAPSAEQLAERVHAFGREIPEADQTALLAWIVGPRPDQIEERAWHWVANETMDTLCHQTRATGSLTGALADMVQDTRLDPVLRDYAIQHIVDWLQPVAAGEPSERDPAKRQQLASALLQAARETGQSFSGTALQGLHNILVQRGPVAEAGTDSPAMPSIGFDAETLRPIAVQMAGSPEGNPLARITALQVCAQQGFTEILPSARTLASSEDAPVSLRLSAIAAVGALGEISDRELLRALCADNNPRLVKSAAPALKTFEVRLQRADTGNTR